MTDQIIEIIHKKLISSTLISEISLSVRCLYLTSLSYNVINLSLLNKQGNCHKQQTSASQLVNKQSKAGNFDDFHNIELLHFILLSRLPGMKLAYCVTTT